MAVPYKKIARKDPRKADAIEKFYPQLVTLGQSASLESIAYEMKEKSSLSLGDIKSVLTNFVEAMRTSLYNGQSVNIRDSAFRHAPKGWIRKKNVRPKT